MIDLTSGGEIHCSKANQFLENLENLGYEDGVNGAKAIKSKDEIVKALQIILVGIKTSLNGSLKNLKTKIQKIEEKLQELKEKNEKLENQIELRKANVKLAKGLLYTICGVLYIFADVEFSRQTIVVAWQMSQDHIFGRISLITGIALATVFLKVFYERFVEVLYVEESKKQDRFFTWFFLCAVIVFVFFFLQLGYVRAVIFEYSVVSYEMDVYEKMYLEHPYMNTVAFIGIENCGHKKRNLGVAWPDKHAMAMAYAYKVDEENPNKYSDVSGNWFAGAELQGRTCGGNCSHESFILKQNFKPKQWDKATKYGKYFSCCKTAFKPYDLAVIICLIIAKHHLKDQILIKSDSSINNWKDGMNICRKIFGYGQNFRFDD